MTYGEEKARLLGVNVKRSKYVVLLAGAILTGSAVAVSGTIGFVGLVIPHFIRLFLYYGSPSSSAALDAERCFVPCAVRSFVENHH